MRTVRYHGRFAEVEVEVAPSRWRTCKRHSTLAVPDHVAAGLLEQSDNWTEVKSRRTGSSTRKRKSSSSSSSSSAATASSSSSSDKPPTTDSTAGDTAADTAGD
jgi:hypothetical protein